MAEKKNGRRRWGNPTIADVAALAQCSPMTVSRVINNEPSVREKTRDAVHDAIRQLNYSPNKAARSLAGASQRRIALLYTNPSASYLSELLMGSLDQAGRSAASLTVERCEYGVNEQDVVRRLVETDISGFVLPSPLCDDQSLLDLLRKLKVRVVLIGPGRADAHHSAVMIDEYQAAYDMAQHIIGLGHKRIGFIIGNPHQTASGQRLAGFVDAMAEAGLETPEEMMRQGQFTYRSGLDAATDLLEEAEPPTAIFASNDDMAAGAVAAAQRLHLEVPGDLTVCGFDDTAIASTIWPELTTIRQPIKLMASRAVEMLVADLMSNRATSGSKARHETLDYALVERGSDAPPGDADDG